MDAHNPADASSATLHSDRFLVDGYHLFLRSLGHGSPTVVLDSGLGRGSDDWLESGIMAQVAAFTRVCAYDRAGIGQSDPLPTPAPRTAQQLAGDLHTLLHAAQLPPPYALVAHSFGGFIVRAFAHLHPQETAGLVLIDAMHEDDASTVLDLLPPAAPDESPSLAEYRAVFLETESMVPEPIDWATSTLQMRDSGSLGACPLAVIAAERFELVPPDFSADLITQLAQAHETLQQRLSTLSSQSSYVIAHGSGHVVMRDRPDCIVQAVRQIVDTLRA